MKVVLKSLFIVAFTLFALGCEDDVNDEPTGSDVPEDPVTDVVEDTTPPEGDMVPGPDAPPVDDVTPVGDSTPEDDTIPEDDVMPMPDVPDEPDVPVGPGPDVTDPSDTGTETPPVTFAAVMTVIAANGCAGGYCHGGGTGGLTLTGDASDRATLLKSADESLCGMAKRVVPGAPDESVLWLRVRPVADDAASSCGESYDKMPAAGDDMGLSDEDAQVVYDWILGGALP